MVFMNSGARIQELQNSEENRGLLAAQRQTYSDAKRIDLASACICLLVPLATTFVQMLVSINSETLFLVWLVTVIAGICLPIRSEVLIDEAAKIQQRFDSSVFGIKFENASRDNSKIASKANRYFNLHNGDSDGLGLDNWYSADIESMRAGDAIARCQHQNTEWTKRLLRRSIGVEVCAALLVAAILWTSIDLSGVDPLNLFFLFSIAEWMIQRLAGGWQSLQKVRELSNALSSYELTSRVNIVRTQDKIFEYRKAPYLVPDWLYSLFKGSDEASTAS